jgi:hypothetical protein
VGWFHEEAKETYTRTADTFWHVQTGGKAMPKLENLWQFHGWAAELLNKRSMPRFPEFTPARDIPNTQVTILGKHLDTNGDLYQVLPDGQDLDVTPKVDGIDFYEFGVSGQKYMLTHLCAASTPPNRDRLTIGVGEAVDLSGMPVNTIWNTSAGTLSATSGTGATLTAPDRKTQAKVTATVGNASIDVSFSVIEPSGETAVKFGADEAYTYGAGMNLLITVHPTDVSFYKVQMSEVAGPPSNITGIYTNSAYAPPYHWPSGTFGVTNSWITLTEDNQWSDHTWFQIYADPIYPGGYDYVIPMRWRVVGDDVTSFFRAT